MSSLRSDISELGQICQVWGLDMSSQTRSCAVEK
jgi:hypothetical protein